MVEKLKRIVLKEISYQLLKAYLIISSQAYCYYICWKYAGCSLKKPSHSDNMARMYTFKTIEEKAKNLFEIKKDLQEFLTLTRNRSF